MPSASEVAAFFIERAAQEDDTGLSNLKLQKLVYYAQGFHLALEGRPLFDEQICAWTHGPVCPELYREYKHYGSAPILKANVPSANITPTQEEILEEVFEVFGQFSAWKLRNMTHEEQPWREFEATGSMISHDSMRRYFSTRLN